MIRAISRLRGSSRLFHHLYSSNGHNGLRKVQTISQSLNSVDLDLFRKNAFLPEIPLLISNGVGAEDSLPAATKWFSCQSVETVQVKGEAKRSPLEYLAPFHNTILPYELHTPPAESHHKHEEDLPKAKTGSITALLNQMVKNSPGFTFHRFNAPLSIFLQATTSSPFPRPRLYIAQAQIADLPPQLQADLPTPRLVKLAGRGDIYDANIWMGIPPTYTPLHKDPNPNLFVQLAGKKRVRLFPPRTGLGIYRDVQLRVGQCGLSSFRGEEMMEGPERDVLEEAVWGEGVNAEGLEALLEPGDAIFIPKGWWHSIKSEGNEVNASVNWWFR